MKIKILSLGILILITELLLFAHQTASHPKLKIMKDVGEVYMEHFGLTNTDFQLLKNAQVDTIESNFDICAEDEDVQYFLDQSQKYQLKVVMPAGSGDAEWGYKCNQENFPKEQTPVWDKIAVTKWVNKWKNHPAIYAWDISNEAGSVLPNAENFYLTEDQLKTAYRDVKEADPDHPIMIRMNGWFFYDHKENFFRKGNPFGKDIADIVMINAYSNVEDYYPDFVDTVTKRATQSISKTDSTAKIIVSVGAWEEEPLWKKPSPQHLEHDLAQLRKYNLLGIAYFKYGAKNSEWYLLQEPKLWNIISKN